MRNVNVYQKVLENLGYNPDGVDWFVRNGDDDIEGCHTELLYVGAVKNPVAWIYRDMETGEVVEVLDRDGDPIGY